MPGQAGGPVEEPRTPGTWRCAVTLPCHYGPSWSRPRRGSSQAPPPRTRAATRMPPCCPRGDEPATDTVADPPPPSPTLRWSVQRPGTQSSVGRIHSEQPIPLQYPAQAWCECWPQGALMVSPRRCPLCWWTHWRHGGHQTHHRGPAPRWIEKWRRPTLLTLLHSILFSSHNAGITASSFSRFKYSNVDSSEKSLTDRKSVV